VAANSEAGVVVYHQAERLEADHQAGVMVYHQAGLHSHASLCACNISLVV